MDRQAFKQRMQQLKQYREQNPGKTYLDWKNSLPSNLQDESNYNLRRAYELGYEPEWNEDDKSYHLPTRDSETGEILKKPWHPTFLIGLQEDAKLGYYPQIKNGTMYTTTWEGNENPSNRTYDLMQEPYARERAKAVDHQYGTDYLKVYDSMLEKYVDIDEYFQLPEPKYKKMERPTIGAQVTPSEGNTIYFNRDTIKVPEDIPNSVVLHEMGHLVDGATGMNNEFLRKLGDKSKFVPFNQAKTMYPNMTRDMYNNILQALKSRVT